MARYEYVLTQNGIETVQSGGAASDAEARREAILFLSEVLRETGLADEPVNLRVMARTARGRHVCRVDASAG